MEPIKTRIARSLIPLGVSADMLTFLGLALAAASGWLCYRGEFLIAAAVLLSAGLLDMLDGEVARVSGKAGAFGGILDSTLDRYGDALVFAGLALYFCGIARPEFAALSLSAWAGSFGISYVRARAECEIDSCRVGFWERGERIGVLVVGLAADNAAVAVCLLGVATHLTVVQRLLEARKPTGAKPPARRSAVYFVKIAVLAAFLLFVRVS